MMHWLLFALFGVWIKLYQLLRWIWLHICLWFVRGRLLRAAKRLGSRMIQRQLGDPEFLKQYGDAQQSYERRHYLRLLGLSVLANQTPPLLFEHEYSKSRPSYLQYYRITHSLSMRDRQLWPPSWAEATALVLNIGIYTLLLIWIFYPEIIN